MNRRIRALALLLSACFVLLFLQLNNLQVRLSPSLKTLSSSYDSTSVDPFTQPRGDIVASDGTVLATSTPTKDGYGEQRTYPLGALFADITGYYDTVQAAAPYGIEAEYDNYLRYHEATEGGLKGVLTNQSGTDSVVLTISEQLQKVAAQAFASSCPGQPGGCHEGAVVAIDPQNGDVLAMYGLPTYDPNTLSSHDLASVEKAYNALANPPSGASHSPLINFATAQLIAPGSTMKVITTSAIFDHDPSLETMTWPVLRQTSIPDTNSVLHNFGGESCGGNLAEILAVSCDTAYARVGLSLGADSLVEEAQSFGFNSKPPLDLPSSEVAAASIPSAASLSSDVPFIAYSAIGQGNVEESALTDALVAAGIGDDGTIMAPHLLAHVVNQFGTVIDAYQPHAWRRATSASTAMAVRALMRGVADHGTAFGVFEPSEHVAAKTGTAETGSLSCSANWMIATAPADPTDTPTIAVAAVVPYQQGLSCGDQGATVAGPIVAQVLKAGLAIESTAKGTS